MTNYKTISYQLGALGLLNLKISALPIATPLQGDEKTVVVTGLSNQRRNATLAAELFNETEASIALREQRSIERRVANLAMPDHAAKPNKKQRRQIHRFKNKSQSDE